MNIIEKHYDLIKSHFSFNDVFMSLLEEKVRVLDIVTPSFKYNSYVSNDKEVIKENSKSYYFSKKTSMGEFSIFFKEDNNEKISINLSIKQKNKNEISQYSVFNFKNEVFLINESLKNNNIDIVYLSQGYSKDLSGSGLFTLAGLGKKYQFVISDNELYSVDNLNLKLNITVQDIYENNKDLLDLILINYDYLLDIEDFITERNKIKEDIQLCSLEILNKEIQKKSKKTESISDSIFSTIKKMLKYKNKP